MSVPVEYSCPFGHDCEKVDLAKGVIKRCVLYLEMKVTNNVTNEETATSNCAFNWNVMLQHETNSRVMGVQQATETFRNEMVARQPLMVNTLLRGIGNDRDS